MNSNDYKLINDIYKYVLLNKQISLVKLKNDFKNFLMGMTFNNSEATINLNKKFYYIFDYFLINGYLEYSNEEDSDIGVCIFPTENKVVKYNNNYYSRELPNLYYTLKKTDIKEFITFDPLKILKAIPKIEDVCNSFTTNDVINFRFKYDKNLKLKPFFQEIKKYEYEVGVYKRNDFGTSYLVLNDKIIKRISRKNENYDALTFSFCYTDIYLGTKIFKYSQSTRKLIVIKNHIPILIFRVLNMCDFNPLLDTNCFDCQKNEFNNVSENIINELKRIFSQDSIGEIYD